MTYKRDHFKSEADFLYGLHPDGLFEIKFNNPKKKNSFGLHG